MRRQLLTLLFTLLLTALLGACGDASATDAGAGLDAGSTTDAGAATDSGATDSGTNDAGTTDAGANDAGATDAGATDAGANDAGATDAGSGCEATVSSDDPLAGRYEGTVGDNDCATSEDCVVGGCSGEVCAAEALASTCELVADPGGTCQCNAGTCIWARGTCTP